MPTGPATVAIPTLAEVVRRYGKPFIKHVGAPLAIAGTIDALRTPTMPVHPMDETLRSRWTRNRDFYGILAGLSGLATGHTLGKHLPNRSAKLLSAIGGGVGGALFGTEVLAPRAQRADVEYYNRYTDQPYQLTQEHGDPYSVSQRTLRNSYHNTRL